MQTIKARLGGGELDRKEGNWRKRSSGWWLQAQGSGAGLEQDMAAA